MVNPGSLGQLTHGQRWAIAFVSGWLTWILGLSIARILPPLLQFLFLSVPICCFGIAAYELPRWRKQGRRHDLAESLKEREFDHGLLNQHQLTMATLDLDFQGQHQALQELFGVPAPQSLPESSLEKRIAEVAGEMGIALLYYLQGRGESLANAQGWISLEKIRSNWGKNYNLKTDELRTILAALGSIGIGEFKDSGQKEWRCTGI